MYEYTENFNTPLYAKARVDGANAFRESVINLYKNQYEDFWLLNRDEVSAENLQSVLDELGSLAIAILQDAATFVTAIETAFPGSLPTKYHSAPYNYTISAEGRLVISEKKEDWLPVEPEPEPEPSEPEVPVE